LSSLSSRCLASRPAVTSVSDLAAAEDPFESDEEYEAFLADLYAFRRADIA
jgi:hypothetical protein